MALNNLIQTDKKTCLEELEKATDSQLWDVFLEEQAKFFLILNLNGSIKVLGGTTPKTFLKSEVEAAPIFINSQINFKIKSLKELKSLAWP